MRKNNEPYGLGWWFKWLAISGQWLAISGQRSAVSLERKADS
ncbi:hypothetical protein [Stenomitos frigidus]|nr:hypothetical protein [Stenomitos frigidus]